MRPSSAEPKLNARRLRLANRYLNYTELLHVCYALAEEPIKTFEEYLVRLGLFDDLVYNQVQFENHKHQWDWSMTFFGNDLNPPELLSHLKNVATGTSVIRVKLSKDRLDTTPADFSTWRLQDRAAWYLEHRPFPVALKNIRREATLEAETTVTLTVPKRPKEPCPRAKLQRWQQAKKARSQAVLQARDSFMLQLHGLINQHR